MQIPEEFAADPLELLARLQERALADPQLRQEWEGAYTGFAQGADSRELRERFREWFLLERPSTTLGAPPAIYWAPQSFDPDGAWARLLDAFLGIFRRTGEGPEGELMLEDLWSGRNILVHSEAASPWMEDDILAVGRFVLSDDVYHQALPGLLVVRAPGLAAALENDLAQIRAANPRGRLSQAECERLFAPFLPAPPAPDRAELERRLRELLGDQSGWPLSRLQAGLRSGGAAEVLNQLAFDTDADLEALRRLLPEYERLLGGPAAERKEPEEEGRAANRPTAAAALARFDAGKADGKPLDQLFRDLEGDLGLEEDSTREGDPDAGFEAAVYVPDFETWVDTYAWEREAVGQPLSAADQRTLREFSAFLREGFPEGLDIRTLSPLHFLSYLLKAADSSQLAQMRQALDPFLSWTAAEQDAPLAEFLAALKGPLGQRLARIADCNAQLAAEKRPRVDRARVTATAPLRVEAANDEAAAVSGFPLEFEDSPRPGDWLLGSWKDGRFQAAALLPQEALPAAPPDGGA